MLSSNETGSKLWNDLLTYIQDVENHFIMWFFENEGLNYASNY